MDTENPNQCALMWMLEHLFEVLKETPTRSRFSSQDDSKPPLVDRPWFRFMLAFLPVVRVVSLAVSYYQYLHNQAIFTDYQETLLSQAAFSIRRSGMQRPWVGISTLLGNPGSLGTCLIPEPEYKYDGTCKPRRPDV